MLLRCQWYRGWGEVMSGSCWKSRVCFLCKVCKAELEPLTLLQLHLFGDAVMMLIGWILVSGSVHQQVRPREECWLCPPSSHLSKRGSINVQLSQISLTWEMDVFFLEKSPHSSHCEFWGATFTSVRGWGEQGGGKIHVDKVLKSLLWLILLEGWWKINGQTRIWAKMFPAWFPEWFLSPILKEAWLLLTLKNCVFDLQVLVVQSAGVPRDGVRV